MTGDRWLPFTSPPGRFGLPASVLAVVVSVTTSHLAPAADDDSAFPRGIGAILAESCVRCHQGRSPKGGLDLTTRAGLLKGGENGPAVVPGEPAKSLLIDYVTGAKPLMPKAGSPLTKPHVAALTAWIKAGAVWPDDVVLKESRGAWWSLRPITRPAVPAVAEAEKPRVRTPIDAFILEKLAGQSLTLSPEADRRTLLRRVTFDLTGLPPTPEETDAFLSDTDPRAYERVVDRLLESPRYGERWARHWLDVVHYGDTHGYDKDKRRPNAWPYRDYVVRALNADKPYARFVEEQLAGDVLWPDTTDGVVATGFLAAGPWDFVGQVELREGTVDKQITRSLDRDDMVSATIGTFASLTVHCARCHDHKFDPIPQADYYSLQAVFAAVDRADRPYDASPETVRQRAELARRRGALNERRAALAKTIAERAGPDLAAAGKELDDLLAKSAGPEKPEFGWHSAISPKQSETKWVQVDLGKPVEIAHVVFVGCHDPFNGIGAGFGFPVRYKVEASDDPTMRIGVTTLDDQTAADVPNPGVRPQVAAAPKENLVARYVRVTATKLAPRQNDYICALAELAVLTPTGENVAAKAAVAALDSIEAPSRWSRKNLVDGYYYKAGKPELLVEIARLGARREAALKRALTDDLRREQARLDAESQTQAADLAALPPRGTVYAAATSFTPAGSFTPTNGKPRPIHVLHRGSVQSPGDEAFAGALSCVDTLPARFDRADPNDEGARRVALARWLVDRKNPLTWRSIVNRVWHHHFGRGLVETPNDFGRMGQLPTHPELLDWLATEFRDRGQSLKLLHRLIVTSAVYRRSSASPAGATADPKTAAGAHNGPPTTLAGSRGLQKGSANPQATPGNVLERARPAALAADPAAVDSGNRLLWRMNRRRLDAEEIRDATLFVSGTLNTTMHGPGFDLFGFVDDHSPHYKYDEHDPDDPRSLRRSIYRFIVRSVPDPFMETFDCADPSLVTPARQATMTPLQALALLNNRFMVRQAEHLASRSRAMTADTEAKTSLRTAFRLALSRDPADDELAALTDYAARHGLSNACRLILNLNEFIFVD